MLCGTVVGMSIGINAYYCVISVRSVGILLTEKKLLFDYLCIVKLGFVLRKRPFCKLIRITAWFVGLYSIRSIDAKLYVMFHAELIVLKHRKVVLAVQSIDFFIFYHYKLSGL